MKTKLFLGASLALSILLSWALARGNASYELRSFGIEPKNISLFPNVQSGGLEWKFTDVSLPKYPGEGTILVGWDAVLKTAVTERKIPSELN